jgi:hypothetical protein
MYAANGNSNIRCDGKNKVRKNHFYLEREKRYRKKKIQRRLG